MCRSILKWTNDTIRDHTHTEAAAAAVAVRNTVIDADAQLARESRVSIAPAAYRVETRRAEQSQEELNK